MAITGADLAAAMHVELEAEEWGDRLDAAWFLPCDPDEEGEEAEHHAAFQELLERVAARLQNQAIAEGE